MTEIHLTLAFEKATKNTYLFTGAGASLYVRKASLNGEAAPSKIIVILTDATTS